VHRARQLVVNRFRDGMPVVGRMVDDRGFRRALVVGLVIAAMAVGGCARHEPGNPFIGPEGSGTQAPIGKQPSSPAPAPVIATTSPHEIRALP
jgi:hypothetical protein